MKSKHMLASAHAMANEFLKWTDPCYENVYVAGSIRREKPIVGDIEIVCIPKYELDLFGEPTSRSYMDRYFDQVLTGRGGSLMNQEVLLNGPKQKKIRWWDVDGPPYEIDIFIANKQNFGYILMLRTGPDTFAHGMVGRRKPSNILCKDGFVWENGVQVDVPDEDELFRLWGMDYIRPQDRE